MAKLRADGGRQAIAHRAKPAAGQPFVRIIKAEILCCPHLVLANLGGDDRLLRVGHGVKLLDRPLRHDHVGMLGRARRIGEAFARAPAGNARLPFAQILRAACAPGRDHLFEHRAAITDNPQINRHRLVDRGAINIDVDLGRTRRECVQSARHPVIEARADAHHHIALVHRHIGFVSAMHPQHPEPIGMDRREGAKAHQRRGDRRARHVLELAQQFRGARAGIDHPAAGVEDRALGMGDEINGLDDLIGRRHHLRGIAVRAGADHRAAFGRHGDLHILGDVDHHGAGAAGGRDAEGFLDGGGKIGRVFDEVIVLGAVARDADGVGLLKGVGANQAGRDLPGDDHQRDRIHPRIGNAGERIGRAGAGGDQHHARLAGRTGIAFGSMGRARFVAHEDMADRLIAEQLVIDRQHRATRIAEDIFHALLDQASHKDGRAAHGGGGAGAGAGGGRRLAGGWIRLTGHDVGSELALCGRRGGCDKKPARCEGCTGPL